MKLLQNKIFIVAVCLVSFILSGLIFADRVFGSLTSSVTVASRPLIISAPNDVLPTSMQAVNVNYLYSAGYLKNPFILQSQAAGYTGSAVGEMWIVP